MQKPADKRPIHTINIPFFINIISIKTLSLSVRKYRGIEINPQSPKVGIFRDGGKRLIAINRDKRGEEGVICEK
jgi:hypothetical protein